MSEEEYAEALLAQPSAGPSRHAAWVPGHGEPSPLPAALVQRNLFDPPEEPGREEAGGPHHEASPG